MRGRLPTGSSLLRLVPGAGQLQVLETRRLCAVQGRRTDAQIRRALRVRVCTAGSYKRPLPSLLAIEGLPGPVCGVRVSEQNKCALNDLYVAVYMY